MQFSFCDSSCRKLSQRTSGRRPNAPVPDTCRRGKSALSKRIPPLRNGGTLQLDFRAPTPARFVEYQRATSCLVSSLKFPTISFVTALC